MEIGSKDKDSIIYCPYLPCKLIFYGSKKNFPISDLLSQIYEKSFILQVVGRFVGDISGSLYEKSPSFIAPYRIAYSIPQMAFAALMIVILFWIPLNAL